MKANDTDKERTLADILPAQPHYYLLSNGHHYARHGTEEFNGVLVYTLLERAEQFVMTVGIGLPEFQPVRVAAKDLLPILMEHGGQLCMVDGLSVLVATISGKKEK